MRPLRVVSFVLALAFAIDQASAAAIISGSNGNWSSTGTWVGGVVPGIGDTATINHAVSVDANVTVGESGAAGTTAITVDATGANTGALTINAGVRLTVRGDCLLKNATLRLNAGSGYRFDSSAASGTPIYKLILGSNSSETGNAIVASGTALSRAIIDRETGSGVGSIAMANTSYRATLDLTYCTLSFIGNGTFGNGTNCCDVYALNTGNKINLDHCVFDSCGTQYVKVGAANNLNVVACEWIAPVNTSYGLWVVMTATTTGTRVMTDNIHVAENATCTLFLETSVKDLTFSRNIVSKLGYNSVSGSKAKTFENNLFYFRANGIGTIAGVAGDTISRSYLMGDNSGSEAGNLIAYYQSPTGTITYDGLIYDTSNDFAGSDAFKTVSGATNVLKCDLRHFLILPRPSGGHGGMITAHGTVKTTITVEHCTLMSSGTIAGGAQELAILLGATYRGHLNFVGTCKSNLIWAKSRGASDGYFLGFVTSGGPPVTGTANGGTTTTLTVASSLFPTTAGTKLGDSAAKLVITGKTGSGPEIGETSTIVLDGTDSGTKITFSPALSAAPDSGTTFSICVVDVVSASNVVKNALYNIHDGTVYNSAGGNPTTSHGYHNMWLSNQAIGDTDIQLPDGTDEQTEGPKFVDPTRNFATADVGALGNATATAWATGTSYVVGDIVSAATASFYGNATINYRCIKGHTSATGDATNGKPGEAASYRTNWEFATIHRIRQDTSKIATVYDWVADGFKVQNATLNNAGHDGSTIGAMGYQKKNKGKRKGLLLPI